MTTISVRVRRRDQNENLITDIFLSGQELPFAGVLPPHVIEAVFRKHDALFGVFKYLANRTEPTSSRKSSSAFFPLWCVSTPLRHSWFGVLRFMDYASQVRRLTEH